MASNKTQTKTEAAQAKQLLDLRAQLEKAENEKKALSVASAEALAESQEEAKVFRVQATGTGTAPGSRAKRPLNVLGFQVPYNQDARVIAKTAESFALDWGNTSDAMRYNLMMIAAGVLIDQLSSLSYKAHLYFEANGLYEGKGKADSQDQAARGIDRMKEMMGN